MESSFLVETGAASAVLSILTIEFDLREARMILIVALPTSIK